MKKNKYKKQLKALRKCLKFSVSLESGLSLHFTPTDELERTLSHEKKIYENDAQEYLHTTDDMIFYLTKMHIIVEHHLTTSWYYIDKVNKKHHLKHITDYYVKTVTYGLDDILNAKP